MKLTSKIVVENADEYDLESWLNVLKNFTGSSRTGKDLEAKGRAKWHFCEMTETEDGKATFLGGRSLKITVALKK